MIIQSFNGHTPIIGKHVFIHLSAIIIGDVSIGDDCSIRPTTVIRGDMHNIRIGCRCSIQDGAILPGCQVHNEVLIGMHASVMDGAIIEEKVILAAGSLVPPRKAPEKRLSLYGFTH